MNIEIEQQQNMKLDFWLKKPNTLFQNWWQLFPESTMTLEEKLNAITRFILLLTIVSFFISYKVRILFIGAITIGAIAIYYHIESKSMVEKFTQEISERVLSAKQNNPFDSPTPDNPFCNVMLTDYEDNPDKKPAPPIESPLVQNSILENAKKMVEQLNPNQPDIADKLFKNMGDEFQFEQSMRPFFSQPSTTIPNDQAAFSQFCYGSMISCKEGNAFACARDNPRYAT
jgi:hypothetical protein